MEQMFFWFNAVQMDMGRFSAYLSIFNDLLVFFKPISIFNKWQMRDFRE